MSQEMLAATLEVTVWTVILYAADDEIICCMEPVFYCVGGIKRCLGFSLPQSPFP